MCLKAQAKKRKIDFHDGRRRDHLGFPIGIILAIFYLKDALILSTKFRVNLHACSGELQNRLKEGGQEDSHLRF